MDTPLKSNLSLARHLWLSVMALFVVITVCFMVYQYRREKNYRADLIDTRLQTYNTFIAQTLHEPELWPTDVRITIINIDGTVVIDRPANHNIAQPQPKAYEVPNEPNHLTRPEIQAALRNGQGREIRRKSATVGDEFFYSATRCDNIIVRTALPYNHSLIDLLTADKDFVWLSIALLIILAIIYELYSRNIAQRVENRRKKIENKLEQSEEDKLRMKRQLTQNVAHELKTPVSSIQGFLDILVNDHDMPEAQRHDFLLRTHQQATRLSNILRDIGMLTRIDEVPATFEKTECNLHDIIDTVAADLDNPLTSHHDTIYNRVSTDCTLSGNASLLYSIFRNLVDNAIAYAGDNIDITIEATAADGYLNITFADNGRGIADEHLPYIFERFYRVDKGRSRSMGGTGLGLAIVKHSVILHGGHIEALAAPLGGLQYNITLKL